MRSHQTPTKVPLWSTGGEILLLPTTKRSLGYRHFSHRPCSRSRLFQASWRATRPSFLAHRCLARECYPRVASFSSWTSYILMSAPRLRCKIMRNR